MNLEFAGIVAEIIGAMAVVITLAFLAVELRNTRAATQSSALDTLATGFNATSHNIFNSSELTEIWIRGMDDPHSLNEIERTRLVLMAQSYVNTYTSVRKYYESGVMPKDEWLVYSHGMAGFMNTNGGKWLQNNIAITSEVKAEFEKYRGAEKHYAYVRNDRDA